MSMRIAVIGTGYVGLVSGTCLADLGHRVTCVDSDAAKIERLRGGDSPIFEPGLDALIARGVAAERLHFTTDLAQAVQDAQVVFIAVGTPASEMDGQPDLSQLTSALAPVARAAQTGAVIVIKSTVPIGSTRGFAAQVEAFRPGAGIALASNPEFLRQGSAVEDFMKPDRIVIGIASAHAQAVLTALYAPFTQAGIPLLVTTCESSEMIKYAANTMLAAKIAFINEMADICEQVGANIRDVARGVGLDARIGDKFLQAGPGFGGSCFPKDTMALQGIAHTHKLVTPLVDAVVTSNLARKQRMLEKIVRACGGDVRGKVLAILGLTFKPGTDDMRESIALALVPGLLERGAQLRVYDPEGMENAKRLLSGPIAWCADAYDAAEGADAAVLLTEWNAFKCLDLAQLGAAMRKKCMIDLRNIYRRRAMLAAGFHYISIGRADISPDKPEVLDLLPDAVA